MGPTVGASTASTPANVVASPCRQPRGFTHHDPRRTFATNLAALGIRLEVTEKLLNHVSGSLGGIVGIYQRHDFKEEMRAAIVNWERRLAEITA
jgi:hypothetical protein